jgi:hypothetical protein
MRTEAGAGGSAGEDAGEDADGHWRVIEGEGMDLVTRIELERETRRTAPEKERAEEGKEEGKGRGMGERVRVRCRRCKWGKRENWRKEKNGPTFALSSNRILCSLSRFSSAFSSRSSLPPLPRPWLTQSRIASARRLPSRFLSFPPAQTDSSPPHRGCFPPLSPSSAPRSPSFRVPVCGWCHRWSD